MSTSCSAHPLRPMRVVAVAQDKYLNPKNPFPDPKNLPARFVPKYGQDITSSIGRVARSLNSVGETETKLKSQMRKLLGLFANDDKSGMAKRLFDAFLAKNKSVSYFEDRALNRAAAAHSHIRHFLDAALSAPNSPRRSAAPVRIHQSLKRAGWSVRNMNPPTNLGVPAFNKGNKLLSTGDFNNGLGLMVNGVQYAYLLAKNYHYNKSDGTYCITLRSVFYDVFGLDDDDLREFGTDKHTFFSFDASIGITAWWQLQHQYGYAPLVTRIVVEKTFNNVPAI